MQGGCPLFQALVRAAASEVWVYFTKKPDTVDCDLCGRSYFNNGVSTSTTRFWKHLKNHHQDEYATTERSRNEHLNRMEKDKEVRWGEGIAERAD